MRDGTGGFFLFLFESFAARALLGSLAAAVLVVILLRRSTVRTVAARRTLLVLPFVVSALLAAVSANRGFLPVLQLGQRGGGLGIDPERIVGAGALLDVLGEFQTIGGRVDLLVAGYGAVVLVLMAWRLVGVAATRRLWSASTPAPTTLRRRAARVAALTGIDTPAIRVRSGCPGGAFAAGIRRPWIALDLALVATLDERELDALLAHEMAHIRRRDPLFCLLTGLCRDVLFFLPGVHIAAVWLRREQEEEADDLAADSTRRPATLASTILKVWEVQTGTVRLANTCQAVAANPVRSTLGLRWSVRPEEQPHALVRVQRLIAPLTAGATGRRREIGVPVLVLALAVGLGMTVPAGVTRVLDNDGLLVRVLHTAPTDHVESPAFSTFRALAPADVQPLPPSTAAASTAAARTGVASASAAAVSDVAVASTDDPLCPCVESPAQLRAGRSAASTETSQLVWSSDGREAWELRRMHDRTRLRVDHELLSVRAASQEVGFFTVRRNPTLR